MPDYMELSAKVGEKGNNKIPDVAFVEALLKIVKNKKGQPYLARNYGGLYNNDTLTAIRAFQVDNGLASAPAPATIGKPAAAKSSTITPALGALPASKEVYGLVGSETFTALLAALPDDYKDATKGQAICRLPGTQLVYLAGTDAQYQASLQALNNAELVTDFRDKLLELVKQMFTKHKVVLSAWGPKSFRRKFDDQDSISGANTQAGPGESNHNFGRAADMGFKDLVWIKPDGTLGKVVAASKQSLDDAFDKMVIPYWRREALWKARTALADPLKVYRILINGGDNDPSHVQDFMQTVSLYPGPYVSASKSLEAHLNNICDGTRVKVGKMKWEAVKASPNTYKCDLGLGGTLENVGSASEIYNEKAKVTIAMLQKLKYVPSVKPIAGTASSTAAPAKAAPPAITAADVAEWKKKLKEVFQLADDNWKDWKALDTAGSPV